MVVVLVVKIDVGSVSSCLDVPIVPSAPYRYNGNT